MFRELPTPFLKVFDKFLLLSNMKYLDVVVFNHMRGIELFLLCVGFASIE